MEPLAAQRGQRLRQLDTTPAAYDAATLAVLAVMEEAAEKHLDAIRPH
ncbi:hypothetical protein GCM10010341_73590 [Streptomyces noursei]|nr:hypothetical protein GCM10010341_73590 [Streptomyces noursei]